MADLDPQGGQGLFMHADEALIEQATFVDVRLPLQGASLLPLRLDTIAPALPPLVDPAWIWHTSFCGSTLLARMLHVAPHTVSLREPLALRRLSDMHDSGGDVAHLLVPVVKLLARPWNPGGRVVLKPTHAALNIAGRLMQTAPGSRAIVLTSSLDDFLVSHLKKTPETLSRISVLAERALKAGGFVRRLAADAFAPPSPLAAAALQWAAQRELVADLRDSAGPDRVRILDWEEMQHDLVGGALDCAAWLGLDIPAQALASNAQLHSTSHAKVPGRRYGVDVRRNEAAYLRARHSAELSAATAWAEANLLPNMRPQALQPWT
jgi:hypothetical protein